ncbi:MAG: hypothetical protein RJA61_506 [Candidatus Parcubacteria bacterium]|jgi:Holliday junction DNA helicase RuvA
MIAHIHGKVIHTGNRFLVIENNGLGYKVFVGDRILLNKTNQTISLWTHHTVREDASDLFGFETEEELSLFELLISVSGIGPKTALGILNITTPQSLKQAVISGETNHLVKVSGIGKKTAEKIVIELRDKFKEEDLSGTHFKDEVDVLEALKSLGYSHKDIRDALDETPKEVVSTQDKIKYALKFLGGSKK